MVGFISPKTLKYASSAQKVFKKTYSELTGLRSMQHIKGAEREIIEAYRQELPHSIWGNPEKLRDWASKKFNEITHKNYTSSLLKNKIVQTERNEMVQEWAELIDSNPYCKNSPFIKLKILRSLTENLSPQNMQLAPVINPNVIDKAIIAVAKTGVSFKKAYFKLIREFESTLNTKTEEVTLNGIRGKWFSIKVPSTAEAQRCPAILNKTKEFISTLSQRSNWCTRTPNKVSSNFLNTDFHIFIDKNGIPQLCLAGTDKHGGIFKFACGNDQYAPIPDKYKEILKLFLLKNKLKNAVLDFGNATPKSLIDLCS